MAIGLSCLGGCEEEGSEFLCNGNSEGGQGDPSRWVRWSFWNGGPLSALVTYLGEGTPPVVGGRRQEKGW